MRRIALKILAIFFPWVILFIYDNPGGALLALIMQGTIVGWLPATIWAYKLVNENEKPQKKQAKSPPVSESNE